MFDMTPMSARPAVRFVIGDAMFAVMTDKEHADVQALVIKTALGIHEDPAKALSDVLYFMYLRL